MTTATIKKLRQDAQRDKVRRIKNAEETHQRTLDTIETLYAHRMEALSIMAGEAS